jgi:CO/xanthine dehydrogenase Mo-binding subunit
VNSAASPKDRIADPIGMKGLGELVIVGVPAAIVNAVFNATGKTGHRPAHHAGEAPLILG